jgi:hypothetical protein
VDKKLWVSKAGLCLGGVLKHAGVVDIGLENSICE